MRIHKHYLLFRVYGQIRIYKANANNEFIFHPHIRNFFNKIYFTALRRTMRVDAPLYCFIYIERKLALHIKHNVQYIFGVRKKT